MRVLWNLIVLCGVLTGGACSVMQTAKEADVAACRALLLRQMEAWNRGDLGGFAEGYWQSEDLVFASASGVSLGYAAMVDRYKKGYPDRATMGKLSFDQLAFYALGGEELVCTGRWRLERAEDRPGGRFQLVFRKIEGAGWRIVLDYTSSTD